MRLGETDFRLYVAGIVISTALPVRMWAAFINIVFLIFQKSKVIRFSKPIKLIFVSGENTYFIDGILSEMLKILDRYYRIGPVYNNPSFTFAHKAGGAKNASSLN